MKKELPIQVNDDIRYMLMYSLPLQAILANENTVPWYMSNYLQYWGNLSREGLILVFSDAVSYLPSDLYHNDYFCLNCTNLRIVDLKKDIITYLKTAVNKGNYTFLFLNENLLPNTFHEGNYFPHEYLVYGYDDDIQQINCIGLNQIGHSENMNFQYQDVENAFDSYLKNDVDPKIITFSLGEFFFRNKQHDYYFFPSFDKVAFLQKLRAYVNETPIYQVVTESNMQFFWGLGLLDGFQAYLQDHRVTKLDYRHPFFFMDQANLIHQRLCYFLKVEKKTQNEYLEQLYSRLSSDLIKLKSKYLKLCGMDFRTAAFSSLKAELIPTISEIKYVEKLMIQNVLDMIK